MDTYGLLKTMHNERKLLILVFATYTICYTMRDGFALYTVLFDHCDTLKVYRWFLWVNGLAVFYDLAPIGLLLYFHTKNFNQVRAPS